VVSVPEEEEEEEDDEDDDDAEEDEEEVDVVEFSRRPFTAVSGPRRSGPGRNRKTHCADLWRSGEPHTHTHKST